MADLADGPGGRPGRGRGLVTGLVALLLVLALGGLAVAGWRSAGGDLDRVRTERQAVEYVRPVTVLVLALSEARAAAAAGLTVDRQAITAAVSGVTEVDDRHGQALGVRPRWADLREQLDGDWPGGTGAGAVTAAGDAVDRSTDLLAAVGRAASLDADPDPAARSLAVAVVRHLPVLVAESGRYAAVAGVPAGTGPAGTGSAGTGPAGTGAAVAADRVGRAAAALDAELRGALGESAARSVDLGLVESVRLAAADVAPAGPTLGAAPTTAADTLRGAVTRLGDASVRLADVVATGLDRVLRDRASGVTRDRAGLTALAVAALLLALGVLWVRLPAAPGHPVTEELGPVVRGPADDVDLDPRSARLIDARALLREVEVVRVGRAVQSVPRHRAGSGDERP